MDAQQANALALSLRRVAEAARHDPEAAALVRDALVESGVLEVFGPGADLDVVDLLDTAGEAALRSQLERLTPTELHALIARRRCDPRHETARWRSAKKLSDYIVEYARQTLELERVGATAGARGTTAAWML